MRPSREEASNLQVGLSEMVISPPSPREACTRELLLALLQMGISLAGCILSLMTRLMLGKPFHPGLRATRTVCGCSMSWKGCLIGNGYWGNSPTTSFQYQCDMWCWQSNAMLSTYLWVGGSFLSFIYFVLPTVGLRCCGNTQSRQRIIWKLLQQLQIGAGLPLSCLPAPSTLSLHP